MAGALSVFGVALAPTAGAAENVTTERLAGATRYGTAAAIAADEAFAAPTMAIVASGENANLADALAASTLAGANAPAPIILTETNTYTAEAKSGLAALKGKGVSRVTIVGGTAAVSTAVEDAIEADGFTVTRVAGVDRFATAAAIANAANTANPADPVAGEDIAFIASGTSFADALAGSPAAANGGIPMLLVNADSIPQATRDALDALDINQAVILGGTVPVSESVAAELQTITGQAPDRLAGTNRFGTAAAIGDYEIDTLGFTATSAILANGLTLVDALTAGPLGGIVEAPIVLTASLPAESQAFLDKHSDRITKLYVAGGTAAVDDATVQAAVAAAENTANDPATPGRSQTAALVGPELQSVRVGDIDTDDRQITYIFEFDTEIDEDQVTESAFKLYNADTDNPATGDLEGVDADVDGSQVAIVFSLADYGVLDASLAAVASDAVEDEDGNTNPPQSVEIDPLSGEGSQGADLVDAEVSDEDEGEVTFTFNSATTVTGLAFEVVLEDGTTRTGTGAETTPEDDEASTTVVVQFDDDADADGDLDIEELDIIRALVYKTGVAGAGETVIQAADVSGGGDVDTQPDLESVEFPEDNADLDDDEVLFTFDEDIDTADADSFSLYYAICDPTGAGGFNLADQCVVDGSSYDIDGDEVTVTFSDEAVNEFIAGAFVQDSAVMSDRDNTAEEGAVGTANVADGELGDYSAEAAEVAGPQLSGVEITTDTDSFGGFDAFEVTFTFDRDIQSDNDVDGLSVWFEEDGEVEELVLDTCETDDDDTVVCSDEEEDSDIQNAVVASADANAVQGDDQFNTGDGNERYGNPEGSFAVSAEDDAA